MKNIQKKVSIIVPAFNVEEYIEECIDSILNQTYRDIEVIIIDDGSTDNTASVCQKYLIDKRVKLYSQKNKGVSVTRNRGINYSTGQYIAFIDADDALNENYIQKLVEAIVQESVEMSCCNYTNTENDFKIKNTNNLTSNKEMIDSIVANNLQECYIWNKLFSKEIIIKNKLLFEENIIIWEDMLFLIKYLLCIKKINTITDVLYYYRTRENSAVNTKESSEKLLCKIDILEKLMKLNVENQQFLNLVNQKYSSCLINFLYSSVKEKNLSKKELSEKLKSIKRLKNTKLSLRNRIKYVYLMFKCI